MSGHLKREVTNPKLKGLLKVLRIFQRFDKEVPIQLVITYIYICVHDKCHKTALEKDLRLTNGSASRNTDWLSKYHRLDKPGLGLIIKTEDPVDRRYVVCRLTNKGKDLMEEIMEALYGDEG